MAASLAPQKKPPPPRLALRSHGGDDDGDDDSAQDAAPAPSSWSPIAAHATHERVVALKKERKRGRVESAHLDGEAALGRRQSKALVGALGGRSTGAMGTRSRRGLQRSQSAPSLQCEVRPCPPHL